jgi:2-polyprenyl-3-methyl-5-hydroxy-6-metoxy-1,4-benzoquinol methylase
VEAADASYDVVFATEIIEHTLDPFYLLKEAFRLLKPGGLLVLTTPNQATLSHRLRLLSGRSIYYHLKLSIMYEHNEWRPHIREYTQAEMAQILRDAGYTIEKATFMDLTDDDPRIWNWRSPLLRLAKELSRLLMRFPSLRHNLLFVGRKPG